MKNNFSRTDVESLKNVSSLPKIELEKEINTQKEETERFLITTTNQPSLDCLKKQKKLFNSDELRQVLMPILEKLYCQDPESLPFRQPVDPELLSVPDYFDIVKKPIDLSTIKKKLVTGQYQDPFQFVDDVNLMFENAWLYNKKNSRVYQYCNKLKQLFKLEINLVMQSLDYS